MAVARKFIDKNVLINVIRHTDAHNKIQEEREMWKAYEQNKCSKSATVSMTKRRRFDGKLRCDEGVPKSTRYMQELYNFEASDAERWGHGGYHELYPKDFDDEDISNSEEKSRKKKSKKNKGERKKTKKGKAKEKWKIRKSKDRDLQEKKKRPKSERSKRKHRSDNDNESVNLGNKGREADHTRRKRKKKDTRAISKGSKNKEQNNF